MRAHQHISQPVLEPEMALIPGRPFLMGSHDGRDNERPVHRVWVDSFEIGKYQVTNREYRCFVEATGHLAPPFWQDEHFHRPNQPVVGVNWFDAVAYCEWLSRVSGREYRLPTEAEWERAARGGLEGKRYSWGDEPPPSQPDYHLRWPDGPEDVGLSPPNGYGLYNIGDNVHEWCLDWYDPNYYQYSLERNPLGPPNGTRRASRGGSWRHQIKISRCAARSAIPPAYHYSDYGFRLARSVA
ncbi:MAG: formylglycine-generating enzyme family protein [Acidobacteria bacterium]|nr:formylglycine-generating enzyme family protein [Acidobacteriota bacterium]